MRESSRERFFLLKRKGGEVLVERGLGRAPLGRRMINHRGKKPPLGKYILNRLGGRRVALRRTSGHTAGDSGQRSQRDLLCKVWNACVLEKGKSTEDKKSSNQSVEGRKPRTLL